MSSPNLTGPVPNPATSELDQTLAALAVAVDRLKKARAAGTAEYGDTDEQTVRHLALKAHTLDPEARSVPLLLGTVGMRLTTPEVEHFALSELLAAIRRDVQCDAPGAALEKLATAQGHADLLAVHAGVEL